MNEELLAAACALVTAVEAADVARANAGRADMILRAAEARATDAARRVRDLAEKLAAGR